jgi:hypothetical protein
MHAGINATIKNHVSKIAKVPARFDFIRQNSEPNERKNTSARKSIRKKLRNLASRGMVRPFNRISKNAHAFKNRINSNIITVLEISMEKNAFLLVKKEARNFRNSFLMKAS